MKKWFLIGVVFLAIAGALYYYVMNKPHRSVADEEGISVRADSLYQAFVQNENLANTNYLNRILKITGRVKNVNTNTEGGQVIVLETGDAVFGINCTLVRPATVKPGDEITLKGICTGYLMDVIVNQAVITY